MKIFSYTKTVILLLASVTLLGVSTMASAEINSVAESINKAGRQRMLTQRMVRMYVQISIGADAAASQQKLTKAVNLFEEQLGELITFSPTPVIKAKLDKVEKLWKPFQRLVVAEVSETGAAELHETNDELLRAAHSVVLALQDYVGTASGKLVNISGRQRMLSQRITKFYMLKQLGFSGAEVRDSSERAITEFRGGLVTLQGSRFNTKKITDALRGVEILYEKFEGLLSQSDLETRLEISKQSDDILKRMNAITGYYVELAQNL